MFFLNACSHGLRDIDHSMVVHIQEHMALQGWLTALGFQFQANHHACHALCFGLYLVCTVYAQNMYE